MRGLVYRNSDDRGLTLVFRDCCNVTNFMHVVITRLGCYERIIWTELRKGTDIFDQYCTPSITYSFSYICFELRKYGTRVPTAGRPSWPKFVVRLFHLTAKVCIIWYFHDHFLVSLYTNNVNDSLSLSDLVRRFVIFAVKTASVNYICNYKPTRTTDWSIYFGIWNNHNC